MTKKERYHAVLSLFEEHNPFPATELKYKTPYELIVAVILSAQCTDVRVNQITPAFFNKYPDPAILAQATTEAVYEMIKSCSYPNNKSKNLIGMASVLMNQFNGIVPESVDDLQKMPGVGRKTANVIASVIYNKPAMAVDTHVFRVSARIGLTSNAKNPLQAEQQLTKYIPMEKIAVAHHWLILHGRYVCKARKPLCTECMLSHLCVWYKKNIKN